MDIRSKKSTKISVQEVIIFILTLIMFTNFCILTVDIFATARNKSYISTFMPEEDYLYSQDFIYRTQNTIIDLRDYVYKYKSEENIKAGKTLNFKDNNYKAEYNTLFNIYTNELGYYQEEVNIYAREDDANIRVSKDELEKAFIKEKNDEIEEIRKNSIDEDLAKFESVKRRIRNIDSKEMSYYATDGNIKIANTKNIKRDDFKEFPVYVIIDRDGIEIGNERAEESTRSHIAQVVNEPIVENQRYEDNKYKIFLGYEYDYINARLNTWNQARKDFEAKTQKLTIVGLILVLLVIRLLIITGRVKDSDEVQTRFLDKIFTDINFIICLVLMGAWISFVETSIFRRSSIINVRELKSLFLVTIVSGGIGLGLVLALVRHLKRGTLWSHSLIYVVINKIFKLISSVYNSGNLTKKAIVLLILYPIILTFTAFIFPVTIAIAAWIVIKKIENFEAIKEGVKQIKDGDLDYKIQIEKDGEFKELAENINDIGQGLKSAVDNELVSERHRSELITNVSHDIRTPLTSIITYIGLLKVEEDAEKRKEYVDILDQKSERLKKLIDDLFEASKVSSGSIPVTMDRINLVSLITQGVGELDDKIKEKNLDFIISKESDEMYVNADGNLLWRAIENLLSNIFKYGLEDSRVYIDIVEEDDNIVFTMKNISAYKLNISEKELMERFKRGDESRSSEGSGLGLSIAESLIKLQKGKFYIEIDGDLFKTTMILQKYK